MTFPDPLPWSLILMKTLATDRVFKPFFLLFRSLISHSCCRLVGCSVEAPSLLLLAVSPRFYRGFTEVLRPYGCKVARNYTRPKGRLKLNGFRNREGGGAVAATSFSSWEVAKTCAQKRGRRNPRERSAVPVI